MDQSYPGCRNGEDDVSYTAGKPHHTGGVSVAQVYSSPLGSPKHKGRAALIWGMGGTILSAVGFIALALFEQYNGMLSELRGDLKHFNQTASEYVKRDSFQKFRDSVKEHFKELQEANIARVQLEHELRASEKAREEMAHELQGMRERLAFVEGQQTPATNSQRAAHSKNP